MFNVRDMHHIQKDIIFTLAHRSPLRFSQLQPAHIPNNAFSYHLKKLVELDYIRSTVDGYIATRKALKIVQYDDSNTKRTVPPAVISMIYVTNPLGQVLLLKHRNRPFVDRYGVPSGLMHRGETLQAAARRELYEKTGIETTQELDFVSVLDFRYLEPDSGDLFIHTIAFIYQYHFEGDPKTVHANSSRYRELLWSDLTDPNVLPEVHTIAHLVKKKSVGINSVDYEEPLHHN